MKPLATLRLALILAVSGVMFTGCATHPNQPAAVAPASTATPPTFAQVVSQNFARWDSNGDGKLSPDEINAAVASPANHDESAAALAAIKLVVRGGKYTLPPITRDYLFNSPLREAAMTNAPVASLDDPTQPKQTGHAPAFQPRYRGALTRLHRVSRELFPQPLPVLEVCHQGPLGDCYFVSVVGAMLDRNPADVKALFHKHWNGTTTVTFANDQKFDIPPLTDAEIALSSTAGTNGLWLTVLENAFGKYRQSMNPDGAADAPDTDIISHGGKPSYVINVLAGYKSKVYSLMLAKGQRHSAQFPTNLMADLDAAMLDHRLAIATTATNSLPPGINGNHAYAILGYNRDSGMLHLWNPHGNFFRPRGAEGLQHGYATRAGRFDIPLKDLIATYKSVTIETPTLVPP